MVHLKIWGSVYTVCEHENFRRKSLKGNGRGRIRERNEREKGEPAYFVQGPPSSYSYRYATTCTGRYLRGLSCGAHRLPMNIWCVYDDELRPWLTAVRSVDWSMNKLMLRRDEIDQRAALVAGWRGLQQGGWSGYSATAESIESWLTCSCILFDCSTPSHRWLPAFTALIREVCTGKTLVVLTPSNVYIMFFVSHIYSAVIL